MSRKRFIKLLMAEGVSRNQAEYLAMRARIERIPYKRQIVPLQIIYRKDRSIRMLKKAFASLGSTMEECARQLRLICEALR